LFGHSVLENLIQALSRTFRHWFEDFQGPRLFSRTFQALKIWKKNSRTFKDPQEPWKSILCWYYGSQKQKCFFLELVQQRPTTRNGNTATKNTYYLWNY